MPKWIYKRIREARLEPTETDLVHIEKGRAFTSSAQVTEYLLCADCEQRFSDVEAFVARVSFQSDGSCPLTDQPIAQRLSEASSGNQPPQPGGR